MRRPSDNTKLPRGYKCSLSQCQLSRLNVSDPKIGDYLTDNYSNYNLLNPICVRNQYELRDESTTNLICSMNHVLQLEEVTGRDFPAGRLSNQNIYRLK